MRYEVDLAPHEVPSFTDFAPFYLAMTMEMARHIPEKGFTWKTMPLEDIKQLVIDAIEEFPLEGENSQDQLIDVANILAMYWIRRAPETEFTAGHHVTADPDGVDPDEICLRRKRNDQDND